MQIGFIGLGNMGVPMAANLVKAGHEVFGFDILPEHVKQGEAQGVKGCGSIEDAIENAEVVITMLPSGPIVLDVFEEIIPVAGEGVTLVDCSTIDVASARTAHALAEKAGLKCLDAPVSGGVAGAAAGTLTFMAGGTEESFETAKPLFDVMGQKAVLCGEAGAGQAAKICNNMLLGISMIGTAEAFLLADKLGLDAQKLFDVVSTASGQCWSVTSYCPWPGVGPQSPADNAYKPGFAAALMLKDLRLAQNAATDVGFETPLGALAAEIYSRFSKEGGDDKDFSAVIQFLTEKR